MPLMIFGIALAVRLIQIRQIRPSPFFDVLLGDANGYDQWAQRLAGGDWIGSQVFYQAPLYPYFLGVLYSVFGRDLLVVRIVQAVIGSASCVLLGMAGARFFSQRVGLIAGLALALWAPAIFFDGLLQKSVLDMFFVCLALYLVARLVGIRPFDRLRAAPSEVEGREPGAGSRTIWVALGLAMGGLALTREAALSFVLVIAVWSSVERSLSIRRTLVGRTVPFVAGLAIVLSPVLIRNYAVDGDFYLTTSQFGPNFYIGNNPQADGTYASIRFGRGAPEFERTDATEVAEASVGRPLSPSEVSSFWTGRAVGFITSQPLAWLKLMGRKLLLLMNRHEMLDTESQASDGESSWPIRRVGWLANLALLRSL